MVLSHDQRERYAERYWRNYVEFRETNSSSWMTDAVIAVAEQARHDLIEQMIAGLHTPDGIIMLADAEGGLAGFDIGDFPTSEMEAYLRTYLPKEAE